MPLDSSPKRSSHNIVILGGDGYLGWSLGLALACRTGLKVILVDNLIKRTWESRVGAKPLVPFFMPEERIAEYKRLYGKTNLVFERVELLDAQAVTKLIQKYKPIAVINAAQQPSAPFSMMNAQNAAETFTNNIVGHLNALWAIAEIDNSIKYIKLGSAGVYSAIDTEFLPLGKVDLEFKRDGQVKRLLNSWIPMNANDFYHQSKISDFLIGDLAGTLWHVKSVTIQQATIFGATIEENAHPDFHSLSTRFNYDDVFGTVINRFVCQGAIDHPITIYGEGNQRTGLISLGDTIDNIIAVTNSDIPQGEHLVVHNFTERLSISEIATLLQKINGKIRITHLENPRQEGCGQLVREVERHPSLCEPHATQRELKSLVDFVERHKHNIDRSIIMPKVKWDCSRKAANVNQGAGIAKRVMS